MAEDIKYRESRRGKGQSVWLHSVCLLIHSIINFSFSTHSLSHSLAIYYLPSIYYSISLTYSIASYLTNYLTD